MINFVYVEALHPIQQLPGRVAQSVMCLTADTCLTADPRVASWIPARFNTFVVADHEIISTAISLPSADSRRVVIYERKYVHKVLVNRLVKKKVWLGELTIPT